MKKITKILAGIIIATTLGGCSLFSSTTTTTTSVNPNKVTYQATDFSVIIPRDWEVLDGTTLPAGSPTSVVVAFKNNIKNKKFIANMNIAKFDAKKEKTTQEEIVKSMKDNYKNTLIDFLDAGNQNVNVKAAGTPIEGIIATFSGKSDAAENPKNFKQLYIKYANNFYVITASYGQDEDPQVVEKINEAINSFELK
ncbi:hypothetical protein M0P48_04645 [Candidatus Gracilibacteria bacterium]|jgi:hypothetical protein|nr:hypothetical protein [Candidatus Gracilibacteria bacterium]